MSLELNSCQICRYSWTAPSCCFFAEFTEEELHFFMVEDWGDWAVTCSNEQPSRGLVTPPGWAKLPQCRWFSRSGGLQLLAWLPARALAVLGLCKASLQYVSELLSFAESRSALSTWKEKQKTGMNKNWGRKWGREGLWYQSRIKFGIYLGDCRLAST